MFVLLLRLLFCAIGCSTATKASRFLQVGSAANDQCAGAFSFEIGAPLRVILNTQTATPDNFEVSRNCIDTTPYYWYPGVWYKFEGTGGRIVFRNCYTFPTISIYEGSCGTASLRCVGGTRSPCSNKRVIIDTQRYVTYYVLIQSPDSTLFDLSVFEVPIVENDRCSNAIPIAIGSTVYGNATYATTDEADVPYECAYLSRPLNPGLWFSFRGTGERLVVRSTSKVDEIISVYKGNCGQTTLKCVGGTADPGEHERFFVETVKDEKYYVLMGSGTVETLMGLSVFVAPPVVTNDFCVNALPFIIGSTVEINASYATSDGKDVTSNCIDGRLLSGNGVWYSFNGTGDRLVFRSCDAYSTISVYKGNCGATNLNCVGGAHYPCWIRRFILETERDVKYFVLLQTYDDFVSKLSISVAPPPVTNDFCANATPVAIGDTIYVNATYATSDELDVSDTCGGYREYYVGVWYSFVARGNVTSIDMYFSIPVVSVSVYLGGCGRLLCAAYGSNSYYGNNVFSFPTNVTAQYLILFQPHSELAIY